MFPVEFRGENCMANEPLLGGGAAAGAAPVKDVSTADFMAEVVDASFDQPVIVDFWAPWCGPCKQLGPVLEKVVRAANGAVRMVKLNIDENPEIATQMRIQSIPAVYAFKDGRPVDGFVGAVPESQIKQFVQRLSGGSGGPSPVDEAMAMAKTAAQGGDHGTAAAIYAQVIQHDPGNAEALGGLARAMVGRGELDQARQVLDRAPKDVANNPEIAAARSALDLAEQAQKAMGSAGKLRARVDQNPDDHEARLELATALFGSGQREEAIDELLTLYKRDREWNEQAARKQLVKFFEAMGPTDPLTLSARRRLSSLMFS
jgi:putative thioredoxin